MNDRKLALLSGMAAALATSLSAAPALSADDNPFQVSEIQRPAAPDQRLAQGRCGGSWEGRCGGSWEGRCGGSREGRCGGSWYGRRGSSSPQGGMMGQSMARHRMTMMGGIPTAYRDLRNPLPATPEGLAQGERLYSANCATCHGPSGAGDGPAGAGLAPARGPEMVDAHAHGLGRLPHVDHRRGRGGLGHGHASLQDHPRRERPVEGRPLFANP